MKPKDVGSQRILRSKRLDKLRDTITPDCVAAVMIDNNERLRTDRVQNFHLVKVIVVASLCAVNKRTYIVIVADD